MAITTSGRIETARPLLAKLDIDLDRIPIVTRDQVKYAKPDPGSCRPCKTARIRGLRATIAGVLGSNIPIRYILPVHSARAANGHPAAAAPTMVMNSRRRM